MVEVHHHWNKDEDRSSESDGDVEGVRNESLNDFKV